MNVRQGWFERTDDPNYWNAWQDDLEWPGEVPCLVVTDYADAAVVYVTCDDCHQDYVKALPCCSKAVRCIVVPLPAEVGNE